ncbi:MAG: homocysteine S-methyltransferase family protein [Thermoguttaceae bacterium]|jgi:methionine synthase I (cobalamin-dependent)|nr:homocysteine S-methyltransferase family protein [Thermoguttaceae bacterium]
MHPLIDELVSRGPVVTDGAWGTQLHERGLPVGACPDGWNLTQPEKVEEVARAYVEAGSEIILTNTFSSNRITLARQGLADQVAALNRAGVAISRRAADGRAKVFASVGPTGVMLMMGDVAPAEVRAAFAEQVRAIAEAGADAIVLETFADPAELVLAIEAVKETGLPAVACMVFDSGKDRDRTLMGTTPEQAARQLTDAGADVIGSNCGQGIDGFVKLAARLHAATERPIWIKANAGLPQIVDGRTVYAQTPEKFAQVVPALIEAGASFVGGCCGTTPEFIRAVRAALKR